MMLKVFLIVLSLVPRGILTARNVNCYYASWGANRPGNGKIASSDIPANLCTHLFYAFLGLNDNGTLLIEDNNLDIVNGHVNLLFDMCKQYNYDGIDIDWEYPQNKATFVDLLEDLKAALEPHGLLLAAAVDQLPINAAYDVKEMTKYLDIINVMSYDFHSPYWQTGQNSPLYFSQKESDWQKDNLNVNSSVTHWIEYGAQPEKISMGCGFYGKAMILQDPNNHGIMAPVVTANSPGPYTQNIGTLGYNELCEFHLKNASVDWDDDQKVPIMYQDTLWVGYDNERSVTLKAQYAIDHNLFGIMMWSVETDDAHGFCGNGNWPLLNAINRVMKGNVENTK